MAKFRALALLGVVLLAQGCGSSDHFLEDRSQARGAVGVSVPGGTTATGGASGTGGASATGGGSPPPAPTSTALPPSAFSGVNLGPAKVLPGLCGSAVAEGQLQLGLSAVEVAGRLSKLFWNVAAPEPLIVEAQNSKLETRADLACFARRMLDDPRSTAGISRFFLDWLDGGLTPPLVKDAQSFPNLSDATVVAARASTQAFIKRVFFVPQAIDPPNKYPPAPIPQPALLSDMLTAPYGYANQALANVLGTHSTSIELELVPVLPNDRVGLLSQPYFSMVTATSTSSSPTQRGKKIIGAFLCNELPPPPPGIAINPPVPVPASTTRDRYELQHAADPACASCHQLLDRPGFAFEHFDAVGGYRTTEGGAQVNSVVSLPAYTFRAWEFKDGSPAAFGEPACGPGTVADHACLSRLLARSEAVRACLSARWLVQAEAVIWDLPSSRLVADVDLERIMYVLHRGRYRTGAEPFDPDYFDLREMMLAATELPVTYAESSALR